jgi:hypothetical protein
MTAEAAPRPVPAQVERTTAPTPAPAPAQDASRYADREAKDKQVADYEGGSVVVFAMSGTAFVALILLLLLL